ncbi:MULTISPECIES: retropepsin-like aspartic protease [Butyricimonas]|uniref:retropepsin-like aspartic protease n=1 Tax=Butyricimonas TaxID=574697 RepID=UPI0007FB5879|nr:MULTISPECIES: retropepsin-like aspartic protease [Butyricimonas]
MVGIRSFNMMVLALLIAACNNRPHPQDIKTLELECRFDSVSRGLFVPIKIDTVSYWFMFDTGSGGSVITDPDLDKIGLKVNRRDSALAAWKGYGKKHFSYYTEPVSRLIFDMPLKENVKFLADTTVGLSFIGCDVINQFYWWFDFEKFKVKISNTSFIIDDLKDWIQIPFKIVKYKGMKVDLKIGSNWIKNFTFDTGYAKKEGIDSADGIINAYFRSSREAGKFHSKLDGKLGETTLICDGGFTTSESRGGECPIFDSIKINGYVFKNCIIGTFKDESIFDESRKTITLAFVRYFQQMYIDTGKQIIYLKP